MIGYCRVCGGTRLQLFLYLGAQPLANRLLAPDELSKTHWLYPLGLEACESCSFVQLIYSVPPEEMFSDYPYTTGASSETRAHFEAMAEDVLRECDLAPKGAFVLDVGSNDGTLLRGFQRLGATVMGIEPAKNLVEIANGSGIPTLNGYFDRTAALFTMRRQGNPDLITACNVFTHVEDVHEFLRVAKFLLKPEGTLVLEIYYLWDLIRNVAFEMCYHEHQSYFSVRTLNELVRSEGLTLWRVEHIPVQGGSIRAYISRPRIHDVENSVGESISGEPNTLESLVRYRKFAEESERRKKEVKEFLNNMLEGGKKVAGYGASAKATVLLNYCEVTRSRMPYVVDDSLLKQGRYIPGAYIPIRDASALVSERPDAVLLFSWNLEKEIAPKVKEKGIRVFVPAPTLHEV